MPSMFVNGVNLVYEEMGTGTPLALTPGGAFGMESVRPMADRLASKYRDQGLVVLGINFWDERRESVAELYRGRDYRSESSRRKVRYQR